MHHFIKGAKGKEHPLPEDTVPDGSYPADIWQYLAPINRAAALALAGIPLERSNQNTLQNKTFTVYCIDHYVYAVHRSDDYWWILRATRDDFDAYLKKTGRKHPEERGIREVKDENEKLTKMKIEHCARCEVAKAFGES